MVYALKRPDAASVRWPHDYVIDFGAPDRTFALLTGWSVDERWGETTLQWSSDRESSLYVYLNEPADRVLEKCDYSRWFTRAPRSQIVAVYVNGALHKQLILERGWTRYELKLPANRFRTELNGIILRYSNGVAPARVIPGNADGRTLAVAFDYLVLRSAPYRIAGPDGFVARRSTAVLRQEYPDQTTTRARPLTSAAEAGDPCFREAKGKRDSCRKCDSDAKASVPTCAGSGSGGSISTMCWPPRVARQVEVTIALLDLAAGRYFVDVTAHAVGGTPYDDCSLRDLSSVPDEAAHCGAPEWVHHSRRITPDTGGAWSS